VRWSILLVVLVACGSKDTPAPEEREPPPRRVIEPSKRDIRALPPHAISATGVGPYKLGMSMSQILATLPSGPRIALLQIPGVLDYSVVRDEGLVVGGERQGDASFIAVLKRGLARTPDGIGVGADVPALVKSLGPAESDDSIARDPRLWVGHALPGVRFVLSGGRVTTLALTTPQLPPSSAIDVGAVPVPCVRKAPPTDALVGIVPIPTSVRGACLDGADAVVAIGDIVALLSSSDGRMRRIATFAVPGLRWVAPLRLSAVRDELVAVSQRSTDDERVITVTALAVEGGRLIKIGEVEAYQLTDTSLSWIGANLGDVDLYVEITRRAGDDLAVSGLLVNSPGGQPVDVAPLLPVTFRTSHRVPEIEHAPSRLDAGADAALPDAEVGPAP